MKNQAIDLATSDVDLLASLGRGEAGALEALAERYGPRIYRLAFGITRNQADAEEVLQDVLLTLARKGGSFEGRSALGSWVYRITTNVALNKRRGKRLEVETPLEDLLPTFKSDGHRAGDRAFLLADWSQSPEEELLSGERRRVLEQAINGLPEHYRAVLVIAGRGGSVQRERSGVHRGVGSVGEVAAAPRPHGPPRAAHAGPRMIPNLARANPHTHRRCPGGRRNRAMMTNYAPMLDFAGSILYLAALLGDRPRSIDHYIDYFGDGTERAGRSEPALSTRLAI